MLNGYAARDDDVCQRRWVFALLDLVVVSRRSLCLHEQKTYARRYIFPGVAGMVVLSSSLLPTRSASPSPNYSGSTLPQAGTGLPSEKTYLVTGGEFDFTLRVVRTISFSCC